MSPGEALPTHDHPTDRVSRAVFFAGPRPAPLAPATLAALPTFQAAVAAVETAYPFQAHPYLAFMRADTTDRAAFLAAQVPFAPAVDGFARCLAATLARVPRLEDRLPLWRNVAEEHGHGVPSASHRETFQAYLRALGASPEALAAPAPAAVLAFEQALLGWCLTHGPEAGAAALGVIEQVYAGISAAIAETVHVRGWVAPGAQAHYAVHEALDLVHARDLFALAAPGWDEPRTRAEVALGLALGAHWFWSVYDGLLAS